MSLDDFGPDDLPEVAVVLVEGPVRVVTDEPTDEPLPRFIGFGQGVWDPATWVATYDREQGNR